MTNEINEMVLVIQKSEEGSVEYNLTYAELFEVIMRETIEPKVESFSTQLRGDVAEGASVGFDLLMDLVEKWDGTGNFHTWYKHSLDNRLIDLVRTLGRDIRSHNTSYAVSLSGSAGDEDGTSPMVEVLDDASLITGFDVTEDTNGFEEMLSKFGKKHPNQASLIEFMLTFPHDYKKSEETQAIAKFFGVDVYTSAIQKRVSRARQSFKRFVDTYKDEEYVT